MLDPYFARRAVYPTLHSESGLALYSVVRYFMCDLLKTLSCSHIQETPPSQSLLVSAPDDLR
jgi:hypothetical protein